MEFIRENRIVFLVIGFFGWRIFKSFRQKKQVTQLLSQENQVIDVRSPGEFQAGHDPKAINLPLDNIKNHTDQIRKDIPVILVCQSGSRSGMACMLLKGMGFTNVTNGGNWQNTIKN